VSQLAMHGAIMRGAAVDSCVLRSVQIHVRRLMQTTARRPSCSTFSLTATLPFRFLYPARRDGDQLGAALVGLSGVGRYRVVDPSG